RRVVHRLVHLGSVDGTGYVYGCHRSGCQNENGKQKAATMPAHLENRPPAFLFVSRCIREMQTRGCLRFTGGLPHARRAKPKANAKNAAEGSGSIDFQVNRTVIHGSPMVNKGNPEFSLGSASPLTSGRRGFQGK